MELSGKIVQILPVQQGQSAKGPWQKQDFIVETQDQFPKKICIAVWNNKFIVNDFDGCIVNVFADVESREFNGKWYTDIKAWKIEKLNESNSPGKKENTKIPIAGKTELPWEKDNTDVSDDLPF
jgi:hypothetical protein